MPSGLSSSRLVLQILSNCTRSLLVLPWLYPLLFAVPGGGYYPYRFNRIDSLIDLLSKILALTQ